MSELVVASGDAPELLDTVEETFDEVSVFVEMAVKCTGVETVGARRNDRLSTLRIDDFNKGIRVVSFVCDDKLGSLILDQCRSLRDIGNLSCGDNDSYWIAQCIDSHMQFGGQPASRTTDFLLTRFFWAPAECWWARTMVESRNRYSMSAPAHRALERRSQAPDLRQREKRT